MRKIMLYLLCLSLFFIYSIEINIMPAQAYSGAHDWAKPFLDKATSYGFVTNRIQNNMSNLITREEFAEIVIKLYEKYTGKTADVGNVVFTDTTNPELLKAANVGLVSGSNGRFSPNEQLTRQQMTTILLNALKVINPNDNYTNSGGTKFADDSKIVSWAKQGVYFCVQSQILSVGSDKKFNPTETASREQGVIVCIKAFDYLLRQSGCYVSNDGKWIVKESRLNAVINGKPYPNQHGFIEYYSSNAAGYNNWTIQIELPEGKRIKYFIHNSVKVGTTYNKDDMGNVKEGYAFQVIYGNYSSGSGFDTNALNTYSQDDMVYYDDITIRIDRFDQKQGIFCAYMKLVCTDKEDAKSDIEGYMAFPVPGATNGQNNGSTGDFSFDLPDPPSIELPGTNENPKPFCFSCHGSGFCQTCDGTGVFRMYGNSSECSACDGSGQCSFCNGTGYE